MGNESQGMDLTKDVLKVVRTLGLSTSSEAAGISTATAGFDDRDFRPSEKPRRQNKKVKGSKGDKKDNVQRNKRNDVNPGEKKNQDPIKDRQWNSGAGPMPDSLRLKSVDGDSFSGIWYAAYDDLPKVSVSTSNLKRKHKKTSKWEGMVEELEKKAQYLVTGLAKEHEIYLKKFGAQDGKWLLKARSTGTAKDRIAAASLLVEQNVVANIGNLEMLLSWITRNKGSREILGHAMEASSELFLKCLLPDRKLKHFADQPLNQMASLPQDTYNKYLILWFVEDKIKSCYHSFISGLEMLTKDNLDYLKQKAIKASFDLLREKPEHESWLLSILVNKLGDPDRKVASKVVYLLQKLLEEHPGMKSIVVDEVENFLFRPQVTQRAQYTSAIFLNQMLLSKNDAEGGSKLAEKLINVYFNFFRVMLQQHDSNLGDGKAAKKKNKSMNNLPKAKGSSDHTAEKENIHGIDSKMLSALLTGINRAFPYVNDNASDKLIEKHSPKLFQLAHGPNFGTCIQALILLYQLFSSRMTLSNRYYRALYSILLNNELATSSKTPLLLSLIFKSLKSDVNKERVAAFLNRLVQVSAESKSNFACGSLLLLSETMKHFPTLWAYINENTNSSNEQFHDIIEDEENEEGEVLVEAKEAVAAGAESDGEETKNEIEDIEKKVAQSVKRYDMQKRDPEHSGMEETCFWEVALLCKHFHPSVSVMSRTLSAGTFIVYDGDPLQDLNMSSFLGKFVQKKAKASGSKFSKSSSENKTSFEPEQLKDLHQSVVDPSDLFFHRFWSHKSHSKDIQEHSSKDEEEETGYDKFTEAMFANDGEESEESGDMSSSVEEFAEENNSSESDEETSRRDKTNKHKQPASGADDVFAPIEDYQEEIENSLMQIEANGRDLNEMLNSESPSSKRRKLPRKV